MLHVTIVNTKTNEVIFDKDVSTVAMQAVSRDKTMRLRHMADDVDPFDTFLCIKAVMKEALDAKKLLSEALTQAVSEADSDESDID